MMNTTVFGTFTSEKTLLLCQYVFCIDRHKSVRAYSHRVSTSDLMLVFMLRNGLIFKHHGKHHFV